MFFILTVTPRNESGIAFVHRKGKSSKYGRYES